VNVVLLLLFFFLLGSSFVLQPGVAVTLPASRFQLTPLVDAQIVSILPSYPVRVFWAGEALTLEEFGARLRTWRGPSRSLVVRGDRGNSYEGVMMVCGRALEEGFSVVLATAPDAAPASSRSGPEATRGTATPP